MNLDPMSNMHELLPVLRKFKNNIKGVSLLEDIKSDKDIKIAVLSSFSMQHFNEVLRVYLTDSGIICDLFDVGFDDAIFELMNDSSKLHDFCPDYVVFISDYRDIKKYPDLKYNEESYKKCINLHVDNIELRWGLAKRIGASKILQTNYVLPIERQFGNLDIAVNASRSSFIASINKALVERRGNDIDILDFEYIASYVGKMHWFSEKDYYLSKQGISFDVMGLASHLIARSISRGVNGVNKCLVVDLDNTLWGGVIGDDGLDGILLGPSNAVGEAYAAFQKYLKLLKDRGVLIAVCSKNDESTAVTVFKEHPYMELSLDDIACFVANWDDKATNIKKIAEELNIGIDSIVFFDDNPAEREIIKQFHPTVKVVEVPDDPAMFVRSLEIGMCFDWPDITIEDLERADSYSKESDRNILLNLSDNYEDYLVSLNMHLVIDIAKKEDLDRSCQLINKTNQFNVRGSRISKSKMDEYFLDLKHKVMIVKLEDKFSSYGIISCIVLTKRDEDCFIDIWVMSCRVFNREIEKEVVNQLVTMAKKWGCCRLIGEYIVTDKNKYVEELFSKNKFTEVSVENEKCMYSLQVSNFESIKNVFHR